MSEITTKSNLIHRRTHHITNGLRSQSVEDDSLKALYYDGANPLPLDFPERDSDEVLWENVLFISFAEKDMQADFSGEYHLGWKFTETSNSSKSIDLSAAAKTHLDIFPIDELIVEYDTSIHLDEDTHLHDIAVDGIMVDWKKARELYKKIEGE